MLPVFAALSMLVQPVYAQVTAPEGQSLFAASAIPALAGARETRNMAARPHNSGTSLVDAPPSPSSWKTLGTLPLVWIQDLSFVSGSVGYAAGGNGQILKTTDGGESWLPVLDLGNPYYWYEVHALNENDVVVSGFIDTTVEVGLQEAIIRWSHDGGASWSDDLAVSDTYWANRVHFWDSSTGFATSINGNPNAEFRTTAGGLKLHDWSESTIDPNGGWFGSQFSALPNGHVRISGTTYCESLDYAANWNCGPSIDPGSDYATFFLDDKRGWVRWRSD